MEEYKDIISTIKDLNEQMEESGEALLEHEVECFETKGTAFYFKASEPDDDEQVVFFKATGIDEDASSYDGTEIILDLTTNEATVNANTSYDVLSLAGYRCSKEEFDTAYKEMYKRLAESMKL